MPDTVDSPCCDKRCFVLETRLWYFWERGISTTGLRKQCLVRVCTYVNDISVELKAVRQVISWRSQGEKEGNDGGKELGASCWGWRSKWTEWLNILAISAHAKQIKTQKYENTCFVAYENTARNQRHQAKRLQEVREEREKPHLHHRMVGGRERERSCIYITEWGGGGGEAAFTSHKDIGMLPGTESSPRYREMNRTV